MSVLTAVQALQRNNYATVGSYHTNSLVTPVVSGNSLVAIVTLETAGEVFTIAPQAYNGTTDVPMVLLDSKTQGSTVCYLYKLDNITHGATSVRFTTTLVSDTPYCDIYEIGNTGGALSLKVSDYRTGVAATGTSLNTSVTTLTTNEFIIGALAVGSGGVTGATAPFNLVTHANYGYDAVYNPSAGTSGSNSVAMTVASGTVSNIWFVTLGNELPSPTVSTVTGNSVTEGTPVRFTLALSGTTASNADYPISWGGTAVNSTDYDNDLSNATFSAGASFVGGKVRVASGYSGCTIDVPTVNNALDQADRTLILTVGGVASTGGSITDNDAPPVVTFSDGVESFGVVTCVATLGAVSGKDVSFQVDTTNGTKTAGTHYTAIIAQTVTIPAGSLTAAITVNTL